MRKEGDIINQISFCHLLFLLLMIQILVVGQVMRQI